MHKNKVFKWLLIGLPSVALWGLVMLIAFALFAFGYVDAMLHGPDIVLEVLSPNGQYVAYVEDGPSIDGPNQSLMIERKDQTRFLGIAQLVEDVDSIKEIVWSPDNTIVVYHSRCYLTAARISDWKILRIYLGQEWRRHKPQRRSTFSGAHPHVEVASIDFPESGTFSYRLKNSNQDRVIEF